MPATTTLFSRHIEDLPERIQAVIREAGMGALVVALKTAFKPNATIPILWIVLTSQGLLLCNTHRTRGLWAKYPGTAAPPLRVATTSAGRSFIEADGVRTDTGTGRLALLLPENLAPGHLDEFMAEYRRMKGR